MKKGILLHFFLRSMLTAGLITGTQLLSACASKQKKAIEVPSPPTTEAPVVPATTPPTTLPEEAHTPPPVTTEDVKLELKKVADLVKKATNPPPADAPAANHESPGVTPDMAFGWLKNGNVRFAKNYLRKDGQSKKDVERLASGQKPHSIVLSCSDSRVPPELVFDQKLGEIFVVRTAGQSLDPNAIASIEYAIEHLGAKNVVVMGHSKCGAVKAAMDTIKGADAGSPSLNHLVQDIHPRLAEFKGLPGSKDLVNESWANVRGVAKDLGARSEIIASKLKSGDIKIREGLYDLHTGVVDFK